MQESTVNVLITPFFSHNLYVFFLFNVIDKHKVLWSKKHRMQMACRFFYLIRIKITFGFKILKSVLDFLLEYP